MRVVAINSMNFLSTGNIMLDISARARSFGIEYYTFSPNGRTQKKNIEQHSFIGTIFERRLSDAVNTVTGRQGSLNFISTALFLRKLDKIKPDIVHLHNLHSNYINVGMLFAYLKKNNIPVVWTLHDCLAFTGHCPNFEGIGCYKWKCGCHHCPRYKYYPMSFVDNSKVMYNRKKRVFGSHEDLHIVCPSNWMSEKVSDSFLSGFDVRVIHNCVDRTVFKPTVGNFREQYGIENKFLILCVSNSWTYLKGIDRILKLAERVDENTKIVLVGRVEHELPDNIISIGRVASKHELAEIYTACDVFLNPTRDDIFPTVNLEALACGTPVFSYGAGGSAEAFDKQSGLVVNDNNIIEILNRKYTETDCINSAARFDYSYDEYIKLYYEILKLKLPFEVI